MYLKRIFEEVAEGEAPRVAHVQILRGGAKQKFSPDLVIGAAAEGWLTITDSTIALKTDQGDVVYTITRKPGYYCRHCNAPVAGPVEASEHIAAHHAGEPSPDPENPSGYMRTHAFKAVRS